MYRSYHTICTRSTNGTKQYEDTVPFVPPRTIRTICTVRTIRTDRRYRMVRKYEKNHFLFKEKTDIPTHNPALQLWGSEKKKGSREVGSSVASLGDSKRVRNALLTPCLWQEVMRPFGGWNRRAQCSPVPAKTAPIGSDFCHKNFSQTQNF